MLKLAYPPLWDARVEARVRKHAANTDEQKVPDKVQMCTRCVMTNQRPRITFNDEGVCSACQYADAKRNGTIDWAGRRGQLIELLGGHQTPDAAYDVIVPCSGGKDSAAVAVRLRDTYNMNPLCACWAPHMYTDIGWHNMQRFIHHGFDVVTAQPNGLLHRKLARLALEYYGDPFLPFIWGQLCWPLHVAAQTGARIVMFGENGEAEYGGDGAANEKPGWDWKDWRRVYMKGGTFSRLLAIGRSLGAISDVETVKASVYYSLPADNHLDRVEFHWFGYYEPWHPQSNYYLACEKTGFEANTERSEGTYSKYASIDDKLDGLHYWFSYLKFGIGRCTSDAAHEIRDGDLERDEALALVARYDHERPKRHLSECLDYLGMTEERLCVVEDRFRRCSPSA